MHNNYYFLRQLTPRLDAKIRGSVISECFSQSKEELILRFEIGADSYYIRANVSPELSCLSFADSFRRARRNSVDLFPEVIGLRVTGIRLFENERSFAVRLSDKRDIVFKMHANRSNVVVFKNEIATDLFRKNLVADLNLQLDQFDRTIDWSREAFDQHKNNLKGLYFTFGKVVWRYLEEHGFHTGNEDEQWKQIQEVRGIVDRPTFFITMIDHKPALSLLDTGTIRKSLADPFEAANEFFYFFTQVYAYSKEKTVLLNSLNAKIAAGLNYCKKNTEKLNEVLRDDHYKLWADLIMANIHLISTGTEEVVLENFYEHGRTEAIKLNKDLSPQKNAEILYRKARNQHIEIERLENSIRQKQQETEVIRRQIARVEAAHDLRAVRALAVEIAPESEADHKIPLPYHQFIYKDFRIWIGKNAVANDTLTLKFSHKEDLWLHAKDVSGSHVLIKRQPGKSFPKDVVQYAASLAAYNSKRKNESLCPVIVTPRKFVRKRKGDPPGAVIVGREEIVMAEPLKPIGN